MEYLTPTFAYANIDRPYLACTFSAQIQQRCRLFHRIFWLRAVGPSRFETMLSDPIELFHMDVEEKRIVILLRITRDEFNEGELTVVMRMGRDRLYRLGFNFIPGDVVGLNDPATLLIARMQGGRSVFESIRTATKAVVMAALDGVARAFALRVVVGVSATNNCSYGRKANEAYPQIYDAFYEAIGGSRHGEGFFALPIPMPQKPISAVKAGHRIRTRRKQEIKARIAESAFQATRAALDSAFSNASRGADTTSEKEAPSVAAEVARIERDIAAATEPPLGRTAAWLDSKWGFLRRWAEGQEVGRLRRLGFDEGYYAETNRDVDFANSPAALHYVRSGRFEKRPARFRLKLNGVDIAPILR